MRFFEDGPDIPDALIEARELGEVVFFCGAGVSAPAGLPDFGGLADTLLDKLTRHPVPQGTRGWREPRPGLHRDG